MPALQVLTSRCTSVHPSLCRLLGRRSQVQHTETQVVPFPYRTEMQASHILRTLYVQSQYVTVPHKKTTRQKKTPLFGSDHPLVTVVRFFLASPYRICWLDLTWLDNTHPPHRGKRRKKRRKFRRAFQRGNVRGQHEDIGMYKKKETEMEMEMEMGNGKWEKGN